MRIKMKAYGEFHNSGYVDFSISVDNDGVISMSQNMARRVRNHLCPRWSGKKVQLCMCTKALPLALYGDNGKFSDEVSEKVKALMLEMTSPSTF